MPATRVGNLVMTSGQLSASDEGDVKGKLGRDVDVADGQQAARLAALNCLAVVAAEIGSLDRIQRIVRLVGYVNSAPGFTRQPEVLNGASELLGQLFGEHGRHVRAAIGVNELPGNYAVELELWAEADDQDPRR